MLQCVAVSSNVLHCVAATRVAAILVARGLRALAAHHSIIQWGCPLYQKSLFKFCVGLETHRFIVWQWFIVTNMGTLRYTRYSRLPPLPSLPSSFPSSFLLSVCQNWSPNPGTLLPLPQKPLPSTPQPPQPRVLCLGATTDDIGIFVPKKKALWYRALSAKKSTDLRL